MMKNGWDNFGDINPIEYGGIFIKPDQAEFPRCYYVVELINMDWAAGEPGFLVTEGYVDLNGDDWIEWQSVADSMSINPDEATDIDLVLAAYGYYGCIEFQGSETLLKTEEEMIEHLKTSHRIFIEE